MKHSKKYLKKMRKRILGFTFSIAMSLMLIAGSRLAEFSMPLNKLTPKELGTNLNDSETSIKSAQNDEDSESPVYTGERLENTDTTTYIYDANDLSNFRDSVNAGDTYSGKTVYVMRNIDMSSVCSEELGVSWEPIGATSNYFAGTFNGNYHILSNLYYNSDNFSGAGLFAQNRGTIQNLILNNVDIYNNSVNIGTATSGIAGRNYGVITNCAIQSGNITLYKKTSNANEQDFVGGISGQSTDRGIISNCYNKASIIGGGQSGPNLLRVGGIAGENRGIVTNCYNTGALKASGHSGSYGTEIGGIIGGQFKMTEFVNDTKTTNCYNLGTVTLVLGSSGNFIGGIIGRSGSEARYFAGGYANNYCTTSTTYSRYYWNGSSVVPSTEGIINPQENLKTYAKTLGEAYETDYFNLNNGYPILKWQAPAEINLNIRNEYIKIGDKLQLNTVGVNSDGGHTENVENSYFTWTSSNPDVATVDANGVVTGTGIGHTTITAYNEETGLKAKAIINVYRNVSGAVTVPQVEQGEGFTVILKEDGTVWSTGKNNAGQLGDGTTTNRNTLEQVKIDENTYLTNIKKISAGYGHVVALTLNGEVYAWGANDSDYGNNKGALGQGDGTNRLYATKVKGVNGQGYLENIIDITCENYNTIVLNNEGIAYGCGNNAWKDITDTTDTFILYPTEVSKIRNIVKLISGDSSLGLICANGETWVKGYNGYGTFGNGEVKDEGGLYLIGKDINEFETGSIGAILKEDGTVWTTGKNQYGQLGLGDTTNRTTYTQLKYQNGNTVKAKTISECADNLQFIGEDGKVYVTGYNGYGQLSNGTANNYAPYPITMKNADGTEVTDCLLLKSRYKVFYTNSISRNLGLIRKDGTVWMSGDNTYGQLGNGTNTSTNYLTAMGTSNEISLNKRNEYIKIGETLDLDVLGGTSDFNVFVGADALKSTQTGYTWTSSNPDVATVDANGLITGRGIGHTTITAYNEETGLKAKAIINVYRNVAGAVTVPQVVSGEGFTVVLKEDGTVWSTGKNDAGQLGAGPDVGAHCNVPVQVKIDSETYLTNVKKISVGYAHAIALTKDGEVYAWGLNGNSSYSGQLGQGDSINRTYATKMKGEKGIGYLENIIDIACGDLMTYALDDTGITFGCGYSELGQITDNNVNNTLLPTQVTGMNNAIKLTSGYSNVGVIKSNGEVKVKGLNQYGAFGNGTVSNGQYLVGRDINEIELFGYSGVILKEDGTLWTTGRNEHGQLGLGDTNNRTTYTQVKYQDGEVVKAKTVLGGSQNLQFIGEDGKTYVTGYNGYGQLSNGTEDNAIYPTIMKNTDRTDVTDVLLLMSGGYYIYSSTPLNLGLIRKDGSVWLSGNNTYGQIGNGTNTSTNYLTAMGTSNEISLNKRNEYIKIGETLDLNVLGGTSDFNVFVGEGSVSAQTGYTWTSSDPDVATVDANGLITGRGIGHTTITAYNAETGLKAKAIINVYRNVSGAVTVPQVVSGEGFTVVLKEDGTVWTTGKNDGGQLGDGTTTNRNTLAQVKIDENTYLDNVKKISVGYGHVIALTLNGEVYGWGYNGAKSAISEGSENIGILGQGDRENKLYAVRVKGEEGVGYLENIIDIACGDTITYALNNEGIIFGCGANYWYQITDGTRDNLVYPTQVTGMKDAIKLTAGYSKLGVILSNGQAFVKGNNEYGAFGNGTISGIGGQYLVGTDIDEFELSGYFGAILKENGTLWTTGRNEYGQLGLGDTSNRTTYTQVKYEDGNVVKAKTISLGDQNLQFIGEDGKVYVTGYNGKGQLSNGGTSNSIYPIVMKNENGTEVTDCLSLMLGGYCIYNSSSLNLGLIRKDGSIWLSGDNTYGQLGNGTNESTKYLTVVGTPTDISLNARNEYIKTGETLDLDVLGGTFEKFNVYVGNDETHPSDGTWTWTSSNKDVATVDQNGLVTGTGIGHTTITAYNEETGLKAKAIINVYRNVSGAITVPGVEMGEGFTVILKEDGTVWSTGKNDAGQLGDGTTTNRNTLEQVKIDENTYLTNIKKVSVGLNHAVALTIDGEVYAWGSNSGVYNYNGTLGQGDTTNRVYATKMKGINGVGYLKDIIDISCSTAITYALNNEGVAYGCGNNYWYQVVDNTREDILYPTEVTGMKNIVKIIAGESNVATISANGEVWVKGHNLHGAFGNGTTAEVGGSYLVGTDINEIALGGYHGVILKEDGTVWTSGYNNVGQLGLGDTTNRTTYTGVKYENGDIVKAKSISTGTRNIQFIGQDGKTYVTGCNGKGQLSNGNTTNATYPTVMKNEDGTDVTDCLSVSSGIAYYIHDPLNVGIIRQDGSIWLSGDNTYGQLGNGTNEASTYLTAMGTSNEISLNARNEYIKTGETLDLDVLGGTFEKFNVFVNNEGNTNQPGWTWTSSNEDVATVDSNGLVTGTGIGHTTITAYNESSGLKLKAIINVYRNQAGAITVPQLLNGTSTTVVLKEDGTVWTTGNNYSGQLGDGTTTNRNTLEQVKIDENTYLTEVRKITIGRLWIAALTIDGKVYTLGLNDVGQLAQGNTVNLLYAKQAKINASTYIENAVDISAGDIHLLVLQDDGRVYASGYNDYNQSLGGGSYLKDTKLTDVIKVEAGSESSSVMLKNGKTLAWGKGWSSTAQEISEDVVDIKMNGFYTMLQKENGEIYVTGDNTYGQLGLGDNSNRNTLTKIELPKDENGKEEKIKYISGTSDNIILMTKEGKVYVSGYNGKGQLCTGDIENRNSFIPLVNKDGSKVIDCLSILLGEDTRDGNRALNIGIIRKDGSIWMSGDNTYGQIGNGTNTSTNYLTPMRYVTMPSLEKVDMQVGEIRTLTEEERTYLQEYVNVFGKGKEETALMEKAEILNTNIATCEGVTIEAKAIGNTVLKLEDEEGLIINIPVTVVSDDASLGLVEVNDVLAQPTGENDHVYEVGIPKLAETAKIRVKARSKYGIVKIGENEGTASEQTVNVNVSLSEDRITVPVEVTASDGVTVENYTIILIRQSNEAGLNKVVVNGTEIENKNNSYTYYLGEQETSAHVEITAEDATATVKVDEQTGKGYLEFDENIEEGTTKIVKTIKVIAEDGTTEEYTLIISRKTQITLEFKPKVSGGGNHFVALKANGSVWTWGLNNSGQLGIGNNEMQTEPVKAKAQLEDGTIEEITDAIDVSAGQYHTIVLRKDGTVWTTGNNDSGQIGNGTVSNSNIFRKVKLNNNGDYLENIIAIEGGRDSSYAITNTGEVYAWGYNKNGELGIGNTSNQGYPVKMEKVSNIVQISAGNHHTVMLDEDGGVWVVGDNGNGQLGLDNTNTYTLPEQMKTADGEGLLYGVKEVSAGDTHTVVLKENGEVFATGNNEYGQLGIGDNSTSLIKQVKTEEGYVTDAKHIEASGDATYISRQNTGMYVMGYNEYGALFTQDTENRFLATPVETDKGILTMAITQEYLNVKRRSLTGAIVDEYGKVYTVGYNGHGELGNGTTEDSITPICIDMTELKVTPESITYQNIGENTKNITCNMTMGFNLLKDYEEEGKYTFTSNDENVVTVDETGRVTAVGKGTTTIIVREVDTGIEKEIPVTVNNYEVEFKPKVVAGVHHLVALKANGSVWTWGLNNYGQLGIGNNENQTEPVKVKAELDDGTIEEITDAIDIAAGEYHTLVLRKDGTVWATGLNNYGQLGDGTKTNTNIFHKVKLNSTGEYLENIIQISAGGNSSSALTKEGEVYVWGLNTDGQLGIGNTTNQSYPTKMQNVSNIIQISVGRYHTLVLAEDGSVWGAGYNRYGQLGIGSTYDTNALPEQMKTEDGKEILYGVKEVSTGEYYTVILKEDGTVWATGWNGHGSCGIGSTQAVNPLIKQVKVKNEEEDQEAVYVTDAKHIVASGYVTQIARQKTKDGKNTGMYVMGLNSYGNLFTQDTENRILATPVEETKDILTMVTTGYAASPDIGSHTGVIVDEHGLIYTVGRNDYGQMGDGTTEDSIIPKCISLKLEVIPGEINYNRIGDNTQTITSQIKTGLNLLKDYEEEVKYTFISNDENVATVDETGRVTAVGKGTTTIIVREVDTGIEKEIPVNVIIETIQKITGQITTENLEGKYKGTVKLYRRKRKDEEDDYENEGDVGASIARPNGELINTIETNDDGTYVLDIDEIGVYDVLITKSGYLSYKIAEIEIKEGAIVEIEEYKLIAGDVAVDGEIEIDDLVDMNRNVGKELTEENAIYDLNEDGKIDMEDRKILKKNYGKKAEETKWVNPNEQIALMNLDIVEDTNPDVVGAGPVSARGTTVSTNNAIKTNPDVVGASIARPKTSEGQPVNIADKFIVPIRCKYTITSTYGYRIHPTTGENKLHAGIDLVGDHHTEILAVTDGEVTYAGVQNGYGNCIEIKHIVNGETIYSFYAHLSKIKVKVGEKVSKGEVIGLEGGTETDENHGTSTGHHLHFEIRTASGSGHSVDPTKYMEF